MNEVKKRYRESKKQLKEELFALKNENFQLKYKLKLISDLSGETNLPSERELEEKKKII